MAKVAAKKARASKKPSTPTIDAYAVDELIDEMAAGRKVTSNRKYGIPFNLKNKEDKELHELIKKVANTVAEQTDGKDSMAATIKWILFRVFRDSMGK